MTEVSTVCPKTMDLAGWPMTSISKVGRSEDDAVEDLRAWLGLDSDKRRPDELLCFDLLLLLLLPDLSSSRLLLLRLLSRAPSTARGLLPSLRYDFWLEADMVR